MTAAQWDAALAAGRFLLARGADGALHFPPRAHEGDHGWAEASGRGTVYSLTWIHPRPPAAPYAVALVDLAEGPRVMAALEGLAADADGIGLAVRARIDKEACPPRLVFRPEPG